MKLPIKIDTGFPSALRVAKRLGLSQQEAKKLALLAQVESKDGVVVLPRAVAIALVRSRQLKKRRVPPLEAARAIKRTVASAKKRSTDR